MRKVLLVAVALLVAALAGTAVAASPHFIGSPSLTRDGNSLVVAFKAAGLGDAGDGIATFNLSGTATVTSQCFTKSGNPVNGVPKHEEVDVNATLNLLVRNGQVTGRFVITPLSTLECTGRQTVHILDVSADLTLSGEGLSSHLTL
jgi:hypothetical protein